MKGREAYTRDIKYRGDSMIKMLVTKKEVRADYSRVISIRYCGAQGLLSYYNPFAYSAGVYGWACDYYEINGVVISTGYQPIGEEVDYKKIERAEKHLSEILDYNKRKIYARKFWRNYLAK